MQTNIITKIYWEKQNLEALQILLKARQEEHGPTERLLFEIERSKINLHNLNMELTQIEEA
jgi:hypothetical protein